MSINNNEVEVIIMKEVDETYNFSKAGKVTEAKEKDPNEKEKETDNDSPYSTFKITEDVKLENSNGGKLDLDSLSIGSFLLIGVEGNKLIRVVTK